MPVPSFIINAENPLSFRLAAVSLIFPKIHNRNHIQGEIPPQITGTPLPLRYKNLTLEAKIWVKDYHFFFQTLIWPLKTP